MQTHHHWLSVSSGNNSLPYLSFTAAMVPVKAMIVILMDRTLTQAHAERFLKSIGLIFSFQALIKSCSKTLATPKSKLHVEVNFDPCHGFMFFYSWFCEFRHRTSICLMHLTTRDFYVNLHSVSSQLLRWRIMHIDLTTAGITSMNTNCACVTILRVAMRCSRNLRQLKQRTQLWHDTRSKRLFMCGYRFLLVFLDDKDLNSCRYVLFSCSICYGLHYTRAFMWIYNLG